jgi:hypothetical protein
MRSILSVKDSVFFQFMNPIYFVLLSDLETNMNKHTIEQLSSTDTPVTQNPCTCVYFVTQALTLV